MISQRGRITRRSGKRLAGTGLALAALALACAACSDVLPLGPGPAAPRQLGSAIILQLELIQSPVQAGGCPAGYTTLSVPFPDLPEVPDACYRKLGPPVTVTSAAVAMSYQPAINEQPVTYGLTLTVAAADAAALTAITTRSFESRDPIAISTAGKTWNVNMTAGPLTGGQFGISVQSEYQVLQLQRILLPSG